MVRKSMEWRENVTVEQKKYLCLRMVFFATVFVIAAAILEMAAYMTVMYEGGWRHLILAALAGAYFPGFLGGIRKLYKEGAALAEKGGSEYMCHCRIIQFQKYVSMNRQVRQE